MQCKAPWSRMQWVQVRGQCEALQAQRNCSASAARVRRKCRAGAMHRMYVASTSQARCECSASANAARRRSSIGVASGAPPAWSMELVRSLPRYVPPPPAAALCSTQVAMGERVGRRAVPVDGHFDLMVEMFMEFRWEAEPAEGGGRGRLRRSLFPTSLPNHIKYGLHLPSPQWTPGRI